MFVLFLLLLPSLSTFPLNLYLKENTIIDYPFDEQKDLFIVEGFSDINSSFCSIRQTKFITDYFSMVYDQTNANYIGTQREILSINNFLFILNYEGILKIFGVKSFKEKAVFLTHLNEFYFPDEEVRGDIKNGGFIKFLFDEKKNHLLVVFQKKLFAFNLNFDDKMVWMSYKNFAFVNQETVNQAELQDNFLYILRNNKYMEVYDVSDLAKIILKKKIEFVVFNFPSDFALLSFALTTEVMLVSESKSRRVLAIKWDADFTDLGKKVVMDVSVSDKPIKLMITVSKLFILMEVESNTIKYMINEYKFNNNAATFIRSHQMINSLTDIIIDERFILIIYEKFLEIIPHLFIQPLNSTEVLKFSETRLNLRNIKKFIYSKDLANPTFNNFFTFIDDTTISIMKINESPAYLRCDTSFVKRGQYNFNMSIMESDCSGLICDASKVVQSIKEMKIFVGIEKNEETSILGVVDYSLIGVTIVLFVLLIVFMIILGLKLKKTKKIIKENFMDVPNIRPISILSQEHILKNNSQQNLT